MTESRVFKDISWELIPAHEDGLANLVKCFQVDRLVREKYQGEPHLSSQLQQTDGWIGVRPEQACARLLSLSLGCHKALRSGDVEVNAAIKHIKEAIGERVEQLAERLLNPQLQFGGLQAGKEKNRLVWKIVSEPADWVAHLRSEIRRLACDLGFTVERNKENDDVVHMIICGGSENPGINSKAASSNSALNTSVIFDKLGFKCRWVSGPPERCGALITKNLGPRNCVRNASAVMCSLVDYGAFPEASCLASKVRKKMPPWRPNGGANNRMRPVQTAAAVILLHHDTTLLMESDLEVARAASLHEADLAAVALNARISERMLQSQVEFAPFANAGMSSRHCLGARSMISSLATEASVATAPATLAAPHCFLPNTTFLTCEDRRRCTASQLRASGGDLLLGPDSAQVLVERVIRHPAVERDLVRLCIKNVTTAFVVTAEHRLIACTLDGVRQARCARDCARDVTKGLVVHLFDGHDSVRVVEANAFKKSEPVFEVHFAGDNCALTYLIPRRARSSEGVGVLAVLGNAPSRAHSFQLMEKRTFLDLPNVVPCTRWSRSVPQLKSSAPLGEANPTSLWSVGTIGHSEAFPARCKVCDSHHRYLLDRASPCCDLVRPCRKGAECSFCHAAHPELGRRPTQR